MIKEYKRIIFYLSMFFVLTFCSCGGHNDHSEHMINYGEKYKFDKNDISVNRPVFSPNNKHILFDSEINGKASIYRIDKNGKNLTKLTDPFGCADRKDSSIN